MHKLVLRLAWGAGVQNEAIVRKTSLTLARPVPRRCWILTKLDRLGQDPAAFNFEIQGTAVEIAPGQNIVLDFTDSWAPNNTLT